MNRNQDLYHRLHHAANHIDEAARQIPPLPPELVHELIGGDRPTQFRLRRQADRYLLVLSLLVLALGASLLWHMAPAGVTPLGVAIVVLLLADGWVLQRAARSLWLMRQTWRLRQQPYRMARYADRLGRLSRRRRWWLGLVLRGEEGLQWRASIAIAVKGTLHGASAAKAAVCGSEHRRHTGTSINHPEGVRLLITRYKPKAQCHDTQTSVNCVPTGRDNGNK